MIIRNHILAVSFDTHWLLILGSASRVRSIIRGQLLCFYDSNTELRSRPDFRFKAGQENVYLQ
jgi:hypothetical protein